MNKLIRKIQPVSRVNAAIRLPGSKSVTHRALLMAALAEGPSEIKNPLVAEDTLLTARALEQLGAVITWEEDRVRVVSAPKRWATPAGAIELGNSGTSTRLLLALAATGTGTFLFDGSPRLRERPIGPILEALNSLGVKYQCLGTPGYPPVKLISQGLTGGKVQVDASQSSQFLSALLIASPCARQEMCVGWNEPIASFPYVALTLSMMEEFGIRYRWSGTHQIIVPAPQSYPALRYMVEGDCSSASYFWAAAALTQGEVYTHPISPGSSQGDCRLLQVLEAMGCRVQWEDEGVRVTGPVHLKAVDLDMNKMPDMVPTLGVLAAFADGRTCIRNVAHLRVKESDRLHVVATELSKLGVPVQELPDGLEIQGGQVRTPERGLEAHDDHRIAMAFALTGLRLEGVEIHGAESVAKSFPSFWDVFEQLKV